MRFVKETPIAAAANVVFAFHERPDALARLTPPWQHAEIVQPPDSLRVGTRVILRVRMTPPWLVPIWQTIEAEHVAYEPGRMFADRMVRGPFAHWLHRHVISPRGPDASVLTDDVEYALPLGPLGALAGGWIARREIERLFAYRHAITRAACEARG